MAPPWASGMIIEAIHFCELCSMTLKQNHFSCGIEGITFHYNDISRTVNLICPGIGTIVCIRVWSHLDTAVELMNALANR
eukprot:1919112-Amphidinium_carterae.1